VKLSRPGSRAACIVASFTAVAVLDARDKGLDTRIKPPASRNNQGWLPKQDHCLRGNAIPARIKQFAARDSLGW